MRITVLVVAFVFRAAVSEAGGDTLSVAFQPDYYPYSWVDCDTCGPKGILVDWWETWASKVDVNLDLILCPVDDCIRGIASGEIDLIAGIPFDTNRVDSLQYGDILLHIKVSLFLKKGYSPASPDKFGEEVGVTSNSGLAGVILSDHPGLKLRIYDDTRVFLEDVQAGRLEGFIYEIPHPLADMEYSGNALALYNEHSVLQENAIRPAFRHGRADLGALLQTGASQIERDELLAIGSAYDFEIRKPYNPWPVAISLVVGLGLLLAIFRRLDRGKGPGTADVAPVRDWLTIIGKGESDRIEFKSSLRWDLAEQKANKSLEYVVIKTIAAFLNSQGGLLFIGVDDDGEILGLGNDYNVIHKPGSDGFLLVLTNLINKYFGKNAHRLIHPAIVSVNSRDICIVEVSSAEEPVFLRKGEREEFYIRTAAASVPLGMREAAEYIRRQWS